MQKSTAIEPQRHALLGNTEVMRALHHDIDSASRSLAKVLLTGETGVGKEVVAQTIHQRSIRNDQPFVTINCAGVPDTLLESAFFGHTRGSFTGAYRDHPGMLRQAHGGTVFLDEVGEMSLRMQALLLRFLETGEIQTVGAHATRPNVDVRVIAATNRDLLQRLASGDFREDLYYRVNVFHVRIPPLRERKDDIPLLLEYYGRVFAEQHHKVPPTLSPATLDLLTAYPWPGNIRELKNVMERFVLRVNAPIIEPSHLPLEMGAPPPEDASPTSARLAQSHQERLEALLRDLMVHKKSFWTSVYPRFMERDLTREDVRFLVRCGLQDTQGSYRLLLSHFNMAADDYKRFLAFLKQHDCHLPFQGFRAVNVPARAAVRRARTESVA